MFRLHRRRIVSCAFVAAFLVLSVLVFVIGKANFQNDTYAVTMPAGFTDQNFYNCVVDSFRRGFPDEEISASGLSNTQLAKITTLHCDGEDKKDSEKVSNVAGIEKMTGLVGIYLSNNNITGTIDASSFAALEDLRTYNNKLTGINFGNHPSLRIIYINDNQLTGTIDASSFAALEDFRASNNKLTGISFGNHPKLTVLSIHDNQLNGALDVSNLVALKSLLVQNNGFTSIKLGNHSSLTTLYIGNNQLSGTMDVSKFTTLEDFRAPKNNFTDVKLGANSNLKTFYVYDNQLTNLDISANPNLEHLLVDDILVRAGIKDKILSRNPLVYDLSGLKFISASNNTTILDTANYTFDRNVNKLTVNNLEATKGIVRVSPIDYANKLDNYKNYKLQIAEIDTNNASEGEDDIVVQNTSGNEVTAKPDTGGNIEMRDYDRHSDGLAIVVPLMIIIIAATFYAYKRNKNHVKFGD